MLKTVSFICALFFAAAPGGSPESQGSRQPSASTRSSGGTQWISPAVVATWITEQHDEEPVQLRLVILWRGTPGWFLRPGGSSVSSSDSAPGDERRSHHTIIQGGVRLSLEFDARTNVASIQGRTLDLHEDNVVFVDDVDSPHGLRVSRTMSVARSMPGSCGQIGLVLKAYPEIMSFLRCDAVMDNGSPEARLERLCVQNLGVAR